MQTLVLLNENNIRDKNNNFDNDYQIITRNLDKIDHSTFPNGEVSSSKRKVQTIENAALTCSTCSLFTVPKCRTVPSHGETRQLS